MKRFIFLRVAGLLTLMMTLICALFCYFIIDHNRTLTRDSWLTRSKTLAGSINRLILLDDRFAVKQMLQNEVSNNDTLRYCFILKQGKPYEFTFDKEVPAHLLQKNMPDSEQSILEYWSRDSLVTYDLATRIDHTGTVLRIGLKRSAIDARMTQLLVNVICAGLSGIAISVLLAFFLARGATRDLENLVEIVTTYGEVHQDSGIASDGILPDVSILANSFIELTARSKKAESELNTLNSELEQIISERTAQLQASNNELNTFAYSVSHDLRSPLRAVEGFSQSLLDDYADKMDAEGLNYLKRIRHACIRMGKLIEDLLKLSRITRSELKRVPVKIGQMAEQICNELQRSDLARKVDFRIDTSLEANADPTLIRTVLENLLGNAWKFTSKTEAAVISFGAIRNEISTVYYVRDNGAGFSMDYVDKLFKVFQRLHRLDEYDGTGIGLASVQRVILLHEGVVWAEGDEGRGASFYFSLGGTKHER